MRVLLADDHPLFLEGLRTLLAAHHIDVVGTARDGREALEKARSLRPDVIVMDIQMPGCDGLTATRQIKAELPQVHVVMLTVSEDDDDLFKAIRSGASGYMLKRLDAEAFFELLADLERGQVVFSPGLAAKILNAFAAQGRQGEAPEGKDAVGERLTCRQIEVLARVAQGLTYKEVGAALSISERTVKHYMREILDRLHLENRAEAITYAERVGLGQGQTPKVGGGPDV